MYGFGEIPKASGSSPKSVILLLPCSCTAHTHTPAAYKYADGRKIDGQRVVVDVERGRTVKGWKPRSLGKCVRVNVVIVCVRERESECGDCVCVLHLLIVHGCGITGECECDLFSSILQYLQYICTYVRMYLFIMFV